MVSECAFQAVVKSIGRFCVVDDELAVEIEDEDGEVELFSIGFIERVFCDDCGIEIVEG